MKTARFTCVEQVSYDGVPIPRDLKDKDIIPWLLDNIDDFNIYRNDNFEIMTFTPIYQVIISNENDDKEYTITIDD